MAKRSRSDTVQLKARMKEPLRAKLEAAAEAKGISLNAEMVHRLEQSFLADEFLGGPGNATAAKLVGLILQDVEARTGKSWREDKDTYYGAFAAVATVMRVLGPQDVSQPEIRFDGDTDADEHIIFDSVDTARERATGGKGTKK